MKKTPYLDILKSLLPSNEWESFLEAYYKPSRSVGTKNITTITHKGIQESEIQSHINGLSRPGQHFLHQGWFFYIQEQAASLPAQVLLNDINLASRVPHPKIILDMCAAPWGKSIQLADKLIDSAFIVSNEPIDPRRKALIFNINRTWCYNTMVTSYDGTRIGTLFPETFDKVLIDAPCSGEWMNYKIAIQQSRDELKIKKIASLQYQLLKSWILACKPWWTIIYSTCTLNPIENEWVIADIMREFLWKIELENVDVQWKSTGMDNRRGERIMESNQASKLARFRPHRNWIGGFFIAKIKKTVETWFITSVEAHNHVSPVKTLHATSLNSTPALQSEVRKRLQEEFWIEKTDNYFFLETANNIYITSSTYKNLPDHLKNNTCHGPFRGKIWIPIYDIGAFRKGRYHLPAENRIPTHHLGNILGHLATKNVIKLTDQQAQDYSDHKDISIPVETLHATSLSGNPFIILTWQKKWFSIGKIVDWRIKNKMI